MGKIRYNHHILKIKMVGDKFIFLKSIINACLGHGGRGFNSCSKGQVWVSMALLVTSGSRSRCSPHMQQFGCSMGPEQTNIGVSVTEVVCSSTYTYRNAKNPHTFQPVNIHTIYCHKSRYFSAGCK
jgi:hypothetical protein